MSDSVTVPMNGEAVDARASALQPASGSQRWRMIGLVTWLVIVTLAFAAPLSKLVRESLDSQLNSYIPLVPFVSAYLLYAPWKRFDGAYRTSIVPGIFPGATAIAVIAIALKLQGTLSSNDSAALTTLAYVSTLVAGGFLFLGANWMAAAAFPVSFLLFMIPLPDGAVHWIETASVLASADMSAWMFRLTGTPLLREGTVLVVPGIVLKVVQECSGIHSSWVLLITSLVAAHLFIRSPWRRFILVAFVIPLAIIRNSFRILVIGLLCVHIGPHMIDSWIHRQGGPVFFALSLVPLLSVLVWLLRSERR